jgi:serine/threonine-protein kinase
MRASFLPTLKEPSLSEPVDRLTAALADRYTIERELGAGGMATVYLAHDIKHDRKVAIKVLRAELAAVIGAERFLAEIKTTANLQHPHILPLFDSGSAQLNPERSEGPLALFYVMPYIEGESLRDRLAHEHQLPVNDAVRIAAEVASALDYAHRHGVVHRDIKPENVMLHDGRAMVADFGIALAMANTAGTRMTETGMSLGTPHYMSPEQAMGEREITGRSDVYALGCITYEMLAGEPPFTGPTAQAIIARVMTEEPRSLTIQRKSVPLGVEAAVFMALEKLPADRFATAAEFATALAAPAAVTGARRVEPVRRPFSGAHVVALGVAGLIVAAVGYVIGSHVAVRETALPIEFGHAAHVTWDPGLEITPAISPDGRTVTYAAGQLLRTRVMVRPIGEGRPVALTGDTTAAETNPQWSPDGARILFLARGGASSAPAGGGPARPELPGTAGQPITGATWAPDGKRIAFTRGDSLFVREVDATVRPLARMPEPTLCSWSPNGTFVACATGNAWYAEAATSFGNLAPSQIVLCRVSNGALTAVTDSVALNHSPAWSGDSHWLYFISNRDGPSDIYAVAVTRAGHGNGLPRRLTTGLGAQTFSLAANGSRIAYSRYTIRSSIWGIPIPANPPVSSATATRITDANEYIETLSVSPDGKWLLYPSDLAGNSDIFRLPLAGGEPQQLTNGPADDFYPVTPPDGKEVAFHSFRSGSRDVFVMPLDGGAVQQVTHTPRQEAIPDWAPDGSTLAFIDMATGGGVWTVRRDKSGHWGDPVQRLARGGFTVWSPDGRSLALASTLTGGNLQIFPADSGPGRMLVDPSAGGPVVEQVYWDKNGQIYFKSRDAMSDASIWSVAAAGGPPRLLVRFDPKLHPSYRANFAVGNGHFYFTAEDRQSDVWIMDVKQR